MKLYTIGHSNHPLEKLARLLKDNAVSRLVDVRSAPYSRFVTQFNKENLERELPALDIHYTYAGKYLGGRPTDPTCYRGRQMPGDEADFLNEVDYPEVMKRPWFLQGISRLLELAESEACAVMCSEENPAECHRHHLITKFLWAAHPDVDVFHIRGDGVVFNAKSLHVSVDKPEPKQPSLF